MVLSLLNYSVLAIVFSVASCRPAVDVKLTQSDSPLKLIATVTNTGDEDISVLKYGSILTELPTRQVAVYNANGTALPFSGISVTYHPYGLNSSDAYVHIPASSSVTSPVDLKQMYRFDAAGTYKVVAENVIQAVPGKFTPENVSQEYALPYNTSITIRVKDRDVAASRRAMQTRRRFEKRGAIDSACSSSQRTTIAAAMAGVKRLADRAMGPASTCGTNFVNWFHTTEQHYCNFVGDLYTDIYHASTLSSTSKITAHCTYDTSTCQPNVLAYAVTTALAGGPTGQGDIYFCPPWWTLPPYPATCSGYGQADVLVHEMSHCYGTQDIAYGYSAAGSLDSAQAAHNADTYMFYARSLNC